MRKIKKGWTCRHASQSGLCMASHCVTTPPARTLYCREKADCLNSLYTKSVLIPAQVFFCFPIVTKQGNMSAVGDSVHFASRPEAWASTFQGLASSPHEHSSTSAGELSKFPYNKLPHSSESIRLQLTPYQPSD